MLGTQKMEVARYGQSCKAALTFGSFSHHREGYGSVLRQERVA